MSHWEDQYQIEKKKIGPKRSFRLADLRFFQGKQRIVGASCGLLRATFTNG